MSSRYTRVSSLTLVLWAAVLLVLRCNADTLARPNNCDPGEFWDSSRSRCSDCPAGTFSGVSGATSCCTCCAGWYQDGSGKSSCKKCPQSRPYSIPGAISNDQCRSGSGAQSSCSQSNKDTCPPTGGGVTSPRAVKRRVTHAANGAGAAPPRAGLAACPFGWRSCAMWGMRGKGGEPLFECVDVRRDLESCGGCVYNDSPFGERTAGGGRDCSAIPNVDDVRCDRGECVIGKCMRGFYLTEEGDRCLPFIDDWDMPVLNVVGK